MSKSSCQYVRSLALIAWSLGLCVTALNACKAPKKPEKTETRSVDALVSGDQSQRMRCSKGPVKADETVEDALVRVYMQAPVRIRAELEAAADMKIDVPKASEALPTESVSLSPAPAPSGDHALRLTQISAEKLKEIVKLSDKAETECLTALQPLIDAKFKGATDKENSEAAKAELKKTLTERINALGACWVQDPNRLRPMIIIKNDPKVIENGLLTTLAYAWVEFFVDRVVDQKSAANPTDAEAKTDCMAPKVDGKSTDGVLTSEEKAKFAAVGLAKFAKTFKDCRVKFGLTVMKDLENTTQGRDTLKYYQKMVDPEGQIKMENPDELEKFLKQEKSVDLLNFFFAESVDTYFCSENGKSAFSARGMALTFNFFQENFAGFLGNLK